MARSEELMALEISLLLDMGRRYGQLVKKSSQERECAEARKRAGRGGRGNGSGFSQGYRRRL